MVDGVSHAYGAASRRLTGGMSLSGTLSLLAVVAVLVVVSVPRLRALAVEENEVDACSTAQLLARALARSEPRGGAPSLRELLGRPELSGVVADAELLARGRLLRRHGYLFEIIRLPPAFGLSAVPMALVCGETSVLSGLSAVRAWPWVHGSTGNAAFLVTVAGASLLHPNPEPHWQGLEAAGAPLGPLGDWRRAQP
jgi:hypothetical protein